MKRAAHLLHVANYAGSSLTRRNKLAVSETVVRAHPADDVMRASNVGIAVFAKRESPIEMAFDCCRGGLLVAVLLGFPVLGVASAVSGQVTAGPTTTLHFTPLLPTPITPGVPLPGRLEARLSPHGRVLSVLDRGERRLDVMRLSSSGHMTPIAQPRGEEWQSDVDDALPLGDDTLLTLAGDGREVTLYALGGP